MYNVVDFQCKAKCPYHCYSWMVDNGGRLQEDKTLSFRVGKGIIDIVIKIKHVICEEISDCDNS